MEDLNYELSEYIKLLRFKSKLSQEETANKLNITRQCYSIWENNPIKLDLNTLNKIGEVFGSDIFIFFNEYVTKSD